MTRSSLLFIKITAAIITTANTARTIKSSFAQNGILRRFFKCILYMHLLVLLKKIITYIGIYRHISANYAITYRSEISLRYRLIAIIRSLCRAEAVLPRAAELAGEVGGKVFKFHAGLFLIIDPAAELANIFHS